MYTCNRCGRIQPDPFYICPACHSYVDEPAAPRRLSPIEEVSRLASTPFERAVLRALKALQPYVSDR